MDADSANEEGRPYEFLKLLGRGAFGKVYHCLDRETKEQCAVKIISKKQFRSELPSILNEVRILSSLNHPNIVKFREVRQSHNHVYIEMELLQGGTLQQALERKHFQDAEAATILKAVISAVAYLHSKDIIHRDIKPANIIFTESPDVPRVKVTDFGLSAKFTEGNYLQRLYQSCGTMSYMAPEQAQRRPYSRPVDIWSCGFLMYMLIEGVHPLLQTQETKESYIEKLQKPVWTFSEKFSPLARDLFLRMVAAQPLERYTAEEVLQHPWITRTDQEVPRRYWERMQEYNDRCKLMQIALKCCALAVLTRHTELPVGAYAKLLHRKYNPEPILTVTKVDDSDVQFRQTTSGFLSPQKQGHKGSAHLKAMSPSFTRLGVSPVQSPNRKERSDAYSRAKTARFVK